MPHVNLSWTPRAIPGLQLWIDFSDPASLYKDLAKTTPVSANNDEIQCAADKSHNGWDASNAVTTKMPLYKTAIQNGLSAGYFDGSNDFLLTLTTFPRPTNCTIFLCFASLDIATNSDCYICAGAGSAQAWASISNYTADGALKYSFNDDAVASVGHTNAAVLTSGVFAVVTYSYTAGDNHYHIFINSIPKATTATSSNATVQTGATVPLAIAQLGSYAACYGKQYCGELIIYNNVLSAVDQAIVEAYLKSKWNIP